MHTEDFGENFECTNSICADQVKVSLKIHTEMSSNISLALNKHSYNEFHYSQYYTKHLALNKYILLNILNHSLIFLLWQSSFLNSKILHFHGWFKKWRLWNSIAINYDCWEFYHQGSLFLTFQYIRDCYTCSNYWQYHPKIRNLKLMVANAKCVICSLCE